jgi:hypothetical protein
MTRPFNHYAWRKGISLALVTISIAGLGGGMALENQASSVSPSVATITPHMGPLQGTVQVKVQGTGFLCGRTSAGPDTRVSFGGSSISYGSRGTSGGPNIQLVTDSEVLVTAPANSVAGPVDVRVSSSCGTSSSTPADVFTYLAECGTSCDLWVSGPYGPATRRVAGVLNGVGGGWTGDLARDREAGYINRLHLTRWRTGGAAAQNNTTGIFYPLFSDRPIIEYLLSDGWFQATRTQGRALAPWEDGYQTWNNFVRAMASGHSFCAGNGCVAPPPGAVGYWDLWNEPTTFGYMSPQGTASQFYDLFVDTYRTLKSVQPNAKIVAPSIESLIDYSLPRYGSLNSDNYISLKDFLDWNETYNHTAGHSPIHFDAFSFHEVNDGATCAEPPYTPQPGCPAYPLNSPNAVADGVNRLRNLLDQYPDLKPAEIEVNEFDTRETPGWQAGYIASFEQANVDAASMTCRLVYYGNRDDPSYQSEYYDNCAKGFDGLLGDDNNGPTPNTLNSKVAPLPMYWLYLFYGSMSGSKLATYGNATDVTAFATRDDAINTVKVLLGRHQQCSPDTSRDKTCPVNGKPSQVSIHLNWPYAGNIVKYQLQPISASAGPSTAITGQASVTDGSTTITIPSVADDDAYNLTVTPA